jgi:hypothetical protein
MIIGYFAKRLLSKEFGWLGKNYNQLADKNFSCAFFSLCIVHFLSLFTSNLLGEFSRHALATQLILLILFFVREKKFYSFSCKKAK